MALSRPDPGPFTNTFTLRRPSSCASRAASSALTWPAYGVFFLLPRKPCFPEEDQLITSPKTVLFISHDRELLDRVATRIATVEPGRGGNTLWVHPGRFSTYEQARVDRNARLEELRRRWDEERAKLKALVIMYRQKVSYNEGRGPKVLMLVYGILIPSHRDRSEELADDLRRLAAVASGGCVGGRVASAMPAPPDR